MRARTSHVRPAKAVRAAKAAKTRRRVDFAELERAVDALEELHRKWAAELHRTAEELRRGPNELCQVCGLTEKRHDAGLVALHDFTPGIRPVHAANRLDKIAREIEGKCG